MKAKLKFGLGFLTPGTSGAASEARAIKISEELHRAARRHFPRRKVISDKIDHIWGADLMDFSKDSISYKKKKYMYVLVNIDVFSKYCWCHVIKNKATENLI
jgi:hypothetical protein